MTRRLVNRPRYRPHRPQNRYSFHASKDCLSTRWNYRRMQTDYPKPMLGRQLLLVPLYRFVHSSLPLSMQAGSRIS